MSKEASSTLPKFLFDEFYDMLREYVREAKARQALTTYDAEYSAGRGYLNDSSQCSELAFNSFADFKAAGWSILANHGWPTYLDIIRSTEDKLELRATLQERGMTFVDLGRRLIRKEPHEDGWPFQEEEFDVDNRGSILKLLRMWSDRYPHNLPYTLTGDE